ncbi:DNA helicase [Tanacetum coccineum]
MNNRRCFETLDRTLRDVLDDPDCLFGGKTIMLGGDFRQTLPVKKDIENGHIGTPDEFDPEKTTWIDILEEYCIPNDNHGISTIMATSSNPDKAPKDKGKMIVVESVEPKITNIADLRPSHYNKTIEAIVYHTSKHIHTQGTPIQANRDVIDAEYFDQLLQLHRVYRISAVVIFSAALTKHKQH